MSSWNYIALAGPAIGLAHSVFQMIKEIYIHNDILIILPANILSLGLYIILCLYMYRLHDCLSNNMSIIAYV